MNKKKIEKLVNEINKVSQEYTENEFDLVIYMFYRFGKKEIKEVLEKEDLEEIYNTTKDTKIYFTKVKRL